MRQRKLLIDIPVSIRGLNRDGVKRSELEAYKKSITAPAARIRRVVFDHATSTADFVYSHASSIVISPAVTDMIAVDLKDPARRSVKVGELPNVVTNKGRSCPTKS